MTFTQATALGILQGATEFLPVSSSGHLAIAQHFLSDFSQPGILFDVLLHLGTMLAVIIYFRADLKRLLVAPWNRTDSGPSDRKFLLLIIVASVPTAIIGLAGKDFAESLFENMTAVACGLLLSGALLFAAEKLRRADSGRTELNLGDALITGTLQGLAIIPGISRSGSTISGLLLRGVAGETAARFSFLLALPAVFGAALLSLRDFNAVPAGELPIYLAGAAAAFVTGLASIHFLLAIIRRRRLMLFALYCALAGTALLAITL
jgi:undecaprenyl-diphosphatase